MILISFTRSVRRYARENRKPYLGICLGFQVGVIEFARTILNLESAHSAPDRDLNLGELAAVPCHAAPNAARDPPGSNLGAQAEFDEATPHPLIVFMPEISRVT